MKIKFEIDVDFYTWKGEQPEHIKVIEADYRKRIERVIGAYKNDLMTYDELMYSLNIQQENIQREYCVYLVKRANKITIDGKQYKRK